MWFRSVGIAKFCARKCLPYLAEPPHPLHIALETDVSNAARPNVVSPPGSAIVFRSQSTMGYRLPHDSSFSSWSIRPREELGNEECSPIRMLCHSLEVVKENVSLARSARKCNGQVQTTLCGCRDKNDLFSEVPRLLGL